MTTFVITHPGVQGCYILQYFFFFYNIISFGFFSFLYFVYHTLFLVIVKIEFQILFNLQNKKGNDKAKNLKAKKSFFGDKITFNIDIEWV